MVDKITREQLEELCESEVWDSKEEFNKLLEQTTGIVANSYTGYFYYDSAGNYVGDSDYDCVEDLLRNAYIEIED
jgi:hypothetical protein